METKTMNKILALAAATLMTVGLTGAAHAGPNCKPRAASSYAPKAPAAQQAQAPAKSNAQRVAQAPVTAPVTAQAGGDGEASSPVAAKRLAQAAPKIVVPAIPAIGDAPEGYTSVSGIVARLAALAAQQKANATSAE